MTGTRPASAAASPITKPHRSRGTAQPASAALAAAVFASAASDAEAPVGGDPIALADLAAIDFKAALTEEQVGAVVRLYSEHSFYVRLALAVLVMDAAGCHEMAAALHRANDSKDLETAHDGLQASAEWLRQTAGLMDKAAARMLAGIARSIVADRAAKAETDT